MKYDRETALREIVLRGERLRRKKERAMTQALAAASAGLFAALALCVCVMPYPVEPEIAKSAYGAFLLTAEAGGYVLAAVIAFIVGAVVTAVIIRRREK